MDAPHYFPFNANVGTTTTTTTTTTTVALSDFARNLLESLDDDDEEEEEEEQKKKKKKKMPPPNRRKPPPPPLRSSSNSRAMSSRNAKGQRRASQKKLRTSNPIEYHSMRVEKWLDAHPRSAVVLNAVFLALTTWVLWMLLGEKIQKMHFERVKPYVRDTGWPKALKFWKENMPEKWQPSENVVEKIWANLRGDDATDAMREDAREHTHSL